MKKFLTVLLSVCLLACSAGCDFGGGGNSGNNGGNDGSSGGTPVQSADKAEFEDNTGMVDDRYDLKTYLYPVWKGKTVYNETLWFAGSNEAPLLYTPDEILSIKSYDLKTVYTEGEDYVVDGKNILVTDSGKIPYMTEDEYFPSQPCSIQLQHMTDGVWDGRYWYAKEGTDISLRQVAVTYTHSDAKSWILPRVETEKFPKTMQKLENGEAIKVLFYGDSITVGANSSNFLHCAPYAESYADMVKSYIEKRYPEAEMTFKNTAVGGTDSNWGAGGSAGLSAIDNINSSEGRDHFKIRVLDENPDLLFIAYGMNDQDPTPDMPLVGDASFKDNIRSMITRAREQNPDVEIMLISGMIANPDTPFYNKDYEAYQDALSELCEEFDNVGLATTLNTVRALYANGKRFQDCTANNVNHPNDFMMRIYAQTVLYSLFGEDYYKKI